MASVRPGIFKSSPKESYRQGVKIYEKAKESYFDVPIRSVAIEQMAAVKESLSDAKLVIGVGRGVKDHKTLESIYQLAEQLGAVVAGTRGAVEMGLIPVSHQIGQTGKVISADCYLALGISGQIQHTAALANCKKIIAVFRFKAGAKSKAI